MNRYLYHGTSIESALEIVQEGFKSTSDNKNWKSSKRNIVYFNDTENHLVEEWYIKEHSLEAGLIEDCFNMAKVAAAVQNSDSEGCVVLKFKVLDATSIFKDDSHGRDIGASQMKVEDANEHLELVEVFTTAYHKELRLMYLASLNVDLINLNLSRVLKETLKDLGDFKFSAKKFEYYKEEDEHSLFLFNIKRRMEMAEKKQHMTWKQVREYFEQFPPDHVFEHALIGGYCDRGDYTHFSLAVKKAPMKASYILKELEYKQSQVHHGWKGGEYTFNDNSIVKLADGPSFCGDVPAVAKKLLGLDEVPEGHDFEIFKMLFN